VPHCHLKPPSYQSLSALNTRAASRNQCNRLGTTRLPNFSTMLTAIRRFGLAHFPEPLHPHGSHSCVDRTFQIWRVLYSVVLDFRYVLYFQTRATQVCMTVVENRGQISDFLTLCKIRGGMGEIAYVRKIFCARPTTQFLIYCTFEGRSAV